MSMTPHKPRRRFRVLLAVSLALNLLFVGIFAGAVWRGGGKAGGPRMAGTQSYAMPYVRALPKDQRRALREQLRVRHPAIGRKARKARYAEMVKALRTEPFDLARLETILAQQAQLSTVIQATGQQGWLGIVDAMDAAERQAYADRLEAHLKAGRKGKRARKVSE